MAGGSAHGAPCLVAMAAALLALSGCDGAPAYDRYRPVSMAGWERADSVTFDVGPVDRPGTYPVEVGLRTGASFPFTGLCLVVKTSIHPSGKLRVDTLDCDLSAVAGKGVSRFQYAFPLGSLRLGAGDSLHVSVRHAMRMDPLPGVSDVGLRVARPGTGE